VLFQQFLGELFWGPLAERANGPLVLTARLGELVSRFLPKGRVGRSHRAVARNGRVVLASDLPVTELAGRVATVRVQGWHRAILPGEAAQPFGLLLCVRAPKAGETALFTADLIRLDGEREAGGELILDVGGRMALVFRPLRSATSMSAG
jgi:hypothetical protein